MTCEDKSVLQTREWVGQCGLAPRVGECIMETIVFGAADGEVSETGALRLRLLAQAPDQPVSVTDSTMPPGSRVRSGTDTPG
jgi:hypothetical protein